MGGETRTLSWEMLRREAGFAGRGMLALLPVLYLGMGLGSRLAVAALFTGFLLFLSALDLRHGMIYDRFLLPMGAVGAGLDAAGMLVGLEEALLAALAGGLSLYLIRWASRGGMGGGDVKLAFVLGLWLGVPGIAVALFLAFLAGAVAGLALLAKHRRRGIRMAFGPCLSLGAWLALAYGADFVSLYEACL